MKKEELRKNYKKACNDYLLAFCEKHDFDFDDAYWVADDVGGVADCSSYTFDMATIKTDVDEDAPKEELMPWYDYIIDALEFGLTAPNYHAWIHGCPRTPKEWFAEMRNLKAERDKVRVENAELKRAAREKFNSIYKLAIEATERLESIWFKPHCTISLIREIVNKTM